MLPWRIVAAAHTSRAPADHDHAQAENEHPEAREHHDPDCKAAPPNVDSATDDAVGQLEVVRVHIFRIARLVKATAAEFTTNLVVCPKTSGNWTD